MALPADRGDPIAYLVLAEGTPVYTREGTQIGSVRRVLAVPEDDVFDGLILETGDGDRFVDAPQVGELYANLVILDMSADDARRLPEPSPSPAAVDLDPDDVTGDTTGDKVRDAARRAWDRISGNY